MLGKSQLLRKWIAVRGKRFSKQKLVVADETCLPVSSFITEHGQGKLLPMTCRRIEMPWEEKIHGIFFNLKTVTQKRLQDGDAV